MPSYYTCPLNMLSKTFSSKNVQEDKRFFIQDISNFFFKCFLFNFNIQNCSFKPSLVPFQTVNSNLEKFNVFVFLTANMFIIDGFLHPRAHKSFQPPIINEPYKSIVNKQRFVKLEENYLLSYKRTVSGQRVHCNNFRYAK